MASGRVEKASPSAMGVRTRSAATGVEIVVPTPGRITAVMATVPAAVRRSRSPEAAARPWLWRPAARRRSSWAVASQVCARPPAPMAWSSLALPDTRAVTRATSARAASRVCWERVSSRQPRAKTAAVAAAMAAITRPATGERAAVTIAARTLAMSADRTGTVTLTCASTTSLRSSTTPVSRSARPRRPSRAGVSGMSRSYAVVRRSARSARATSCERRRSQ